MARITVEDCLEKVDNRFSLVHLAAKRVRQIKNGAPTKIKSRNKDIVVSLREIASGLVYSANSGIKPELNVLDVDMIELKSDED